MTSILKNILSVSEEYAHNRKRQRKSDHAVAKESDFAAKETPKVAVKYIKEKAKAKCSNTNVVQEAPNI